MAPRDREREIVAEATCYFAEHGLNGGTTELARRIGITQPLLYKYFSTKTALIERVYAELLPADWSARWEGLLEDTSITIEQRLKTFYREFSETVLTYHHVRLFLFSGLGHYDFNHRYYAILTDRMFTRIARALRTEFGSGDSKVTDEDLELVQSLHAAIYHIAFRRFVHKPPQLEEIPAIVDRKIEFFLHGAMATIRQSGQPTSSTGP